MLFVCTGRPSTLQTVDKRYIKDHSKASYCGYRAQYGLCAKRSVTRKVAMYDEGGAVEAGQSKRAVEAGIARSLPQQDLSLPQPAEAKRHEIHTDMANGAGA